MENGKLRPQICGRGLKLDNISDNLPAHYPSINGASPRAYEVAQESAATQVVA